jgi:hypothetical protein
MLFERTAYMGIEVQENEKNDHGDSTRRQIYEETPVISLCESCQIVLYLTSLPSPCNMVGKGLEIW